MITPPRIRWIFDIAVVPAAVAAVDPALDLSVAGAVVPAVFAAVKPAIELPVASAVVPALVAARDQGRLAPLAPSYHTS